MSVPERRISWSIATTTKVLNSSITSTIVTDTFTTKNPISFSGKTSDGKTGGAAENSLLLVALSAGGACLVLIIVAAIVCCVVCKKSRKRRNYPLPNSHVRRGVSFSDSLETNIVRPRSPVTTAADIYGDLQTPTGSEKYSTFESPVKKSNLRNGCFENPVYKTNNSNLFNDSVSNRTTTTAPMRHFSFGGRSSLKNGDKTYSFEGADNKNEILDNRKMSSTPPVLIFDDVSSDDHGRLVPNDWLALEIDRNQKYLRDRREARRHLFECESVKNEDFTSASSTREKADEADAKSLASTTVFPGRKLRRRLAEKIASDRVMETTVTFTNNNTVTTCRAPEILDTPSSEYPCATPASTIFGNTPAIHRTPSFGNEVNVNDEVEEDDDLEVIFQERTPV